MVESNYIIEETGEIVELWSKSRLPFEPKGWLLQMRNSLRKSLMKVHTSQGLILHALYVSDIEEYFDVENILIYNVGSGAFSNSCQHGICFERKFTSPLQPMGRDGGFRHYHRYCLIEKEKGPIYWKKKYSIANWTSIPCPALKGANKPHSYWYAIKKGRVSVIDESELHSYFGIDIKIYAPKGTKINLASVIKPLLDGVISAFHSHDGTHNSSVVERIALSIGEKELYIHNLLMDQSMQVLGRRNLIHPFGKGVQWNPADDLCVMAKVTIDDCLFDSQWTIDGEIFSVVPNYD